MVYHHLGAFIRIAAPQYVVGLLEWASGLELVVEEEGTRVPLKSTSHVTCWIRAQPSQPTLLTSESPVPILPLLSCLYYKRLTHSNPEDMFWAVGLFLITFILTTFLAATTGNRQRRTMKPVQPAMFFLPTKSRLGRAQHVEATEGIETMPKHVVRRVLDWYF